MTSLVKELFRQFKNQYVAQSLIGFVTVYTTLAVLAIVKAINFGTPYPLGATVILFGLFTYYWDRNERSIKHEAVPFVGYFTLIAYPVMILAVDKHSLVLPALVLVNAVYQRDVVKLHVVGGLMSITVINAIFFDAENWLYWAQLLIVSGLGVVVTTIVMQELKVHVDNAADRTRELHTLTQRQERVFATIGHEIRTPASTVAMLLDEYKLDKSPITIREAEIQMAHLLSVLDDMRVSVDKSFILERLNTVESVRVWATLERALLGVYPLANKHKVTVELKGSIPNTPHNGNPKAIMQIVQNLTKNAIIHSGGTQVTIETAHRKKNGLSHFKVQIIDDGSGIDDDYIRHMWEPFSRGKTTANGTGLGLHVCREMARALPEGALIYSKGKDGGSVFTLMFSLEELNQLDRRTAESQINPAEHVAQSGGALKHELDLDGLRVLLVEDTPTLRALGEAILSRAGVVVSVAEDGLEGLKIVQNEEFDVILTDIHMPNMNGYEMTEAIREREIKVPVIGVTGATVGVEAQRLISAGADVVLSKPLTLDKFKSALKDIEGVS